MTLRKILSQEVDTPGVYVIFNVSYDSLENQATCFGITITASLPASVINHNSW